MSKSSERETSIALWPKTLPKRYERFGFLGGWMRYAYNAGYRAGRAKRRKKR